MKIGARDADRFAAAPPAGIRAVLVYGPDAGLVRERAEKLVLSAAETLNDPFRVSEFVAARLADEPALLHDEGAALSLMGGRRAVRVRDAADRAADAFAAFFKDPPPGDTLIVVEGGDLGPRSGLRKIFENAEAGAALPCYGDDAGAVRRLAEEAFRDRRIRASRDAMAYLAAVLGSDRELTRREIEKLTLYAGDGGALDLDDVVAALGDSGASAAEDVALAAAEGRATALDRALNRAFADGQSAVGLIRACLRHFQRLSLARLRMDQGDPLNAAMQALRPPVFFKAQPAFEAALKRWGSDELAAAGLALTRMEIAAKTTGTPEDVVVRQGLLDLAEKRLEDPA